MHDTTIDTTAGSRGDLRIAIRDCASEQARMALESLLSVVYRRPVTLEGLLTELGASPSVIGAIRHGGMDRITDTLRECVKSRVAIGTGGERRHEVLERYFGLDGYPPSTLTTMATKYGISRERVRQIKERAICSIRNRYAKALIEHSLVSQCSTQAGLAAMSSVSLSMVPGARWSHDLATRSLSASVDLTSSEQSGFRLLSHRELLMAADPDLISTAEQSEILQRITESSKLVVNGCTGSGKSWLALATARKLALEGKRTLLTCFNRRVADYYTSVFSSMDGLTVASFHALCLRLGRVAGINIPGGWNSRAWSERFPDVLTRAMMRDPKLRFDAIIVDDAQEMQPHWWRTLETSLSDPERGHLYCFMDRFLATQMLTNSLPVDVELSTNLRTPRCVGESFVGALSGKSKVWYRRDDDVTVEFFVCETDEAFCQSLAFLFSELESTGISPLETAVLSPRLPKYSSVARAPLPGKARLVKSQSSIENHAVLCRIENFHGLERKAIVLVDLDEKMNLLADEELARLLYIGCSRFTDRLYLLGSSRALNRLVRTIPNLLFSPRALNRSLMLVR
ncbi:MAG: hypothetical protein K2Z81_09860 [Cyanobacteria bacterium]|nr:hypothetical protein [Cyanobacteriota bacterium]